MQRHSGHLLGLTLERICNSSNAYQEEVCSLCSSETRKWFSLSSASTIIVLHAEKTTTTTGVEFTVAYSFSTCVQISVMKINYTSFE